MRHRSGDTLQKKVISRLEILSKFYVLFSHLTIQRVYDEERFTPVFSKKYSFVRHIDWLQCDIFVKSNKKRCGNANTCFFRLQFSFYEGIMKTYTFYVRLI